MEMGRADVGEVSGGGIPWISDMIWVEAENVGRSKEWECGCGRVGRIWTS
jgi:hypothetical protein